MKTINLLNLITAAFILGTILGGCKKKEPPIVITGDVPVASITFNSAEVGGEVTDDGGAAVTERGIVFDTSSDPEVSGQSFQIGSGTGVFVKALTGLAPNTTYYLKAYAKNTEGIGYGEQVDFKTLLELTLPCVSTNQVSSFTTNSAVIGGNVTCDGNASITERGVYWGTDPNPENSGTKLVIGSGTGTFSATLSGLTQNTTYYIKAFAANSVGTAFAPTVVTFKTGIEISLPTVVTSSVAEYSQTTATVGGNVTNDGNGTVTERGVYWGTTQNPETSGTKLQIGSGIGIFSTTLPGLIPDTRYYIKAYAINSNGTAYGSQVNFSTPSASGILFNPNLTYGSVTDIDGNSYKTIEIGTQTWMAENLRTTKFNDGNSIQLVTSNSTWASLNTPAFCWYNNAESENKSTYGGLYNWYATSNGRLCPNGWHVPSHTEFITLREYLGGQSTAGGRMKESNLTHWNSPNTGATNESGFTAVPSGTRTGFDGPFFYLGEDGHYWSSTSYDNGSAYHWYTYYNTASFQTGNTLKNTGYAIRCIKTTGESIPANGLVAYYPFKGNFSDESSYTNDGTNYGTQFTNDRNGVVSQAINLNGTSNYVSVPNNASFSFGTGNFTIAAVIKTGIIPAGSWSAIVTKHNTDTNHDTEFFLQLEGGTGRPQFGVSSYLGVFERITGTANICDNSFHILCGVRINGQIRLYIDGILVGTASSSINPNNTNPINIGRSSYDSGYGYFNGVIDDVVIYNRALTEPEINNLFQ